MKDYWGYKGQVVVVTGAASGMGKATAEMLVDLGAKVYALDWAEVKVKGIEKYIHVDLGNKESIDSAFKQIPNKVHAFFGIAGVSGAKTDFLTTVKIDFVSNKYICSELLPSRMVKGDSITFITSTAGIGWEKADNRDVYIPVIEAEGWDATIKAIEQTGFAVMPGTLGYPFSKLMMNYLTVYEHKKLSAKGIRVNAVLPGATDTGLKGDFSAMAKGDDNLISNNGDAGRLACPEEMAAPTVFLSSNMASFISGELLNVDFGYTKEQVAGITPSAMQLSLVGLQAHMKQMKG